MASFRFFFLFSSILLFLQPSRGQESCPSDCGGKLRVRFPFQLSSSLPENRCGYPGFTVLCKNETQTILNFPFSGDFRIDSISYSSQDILITDPSNCTARRFLQGFNYSHTPFQPIYTRNFTFLNCTPDAPIFSSPAAASPIRCLSSESHLVVALPTERVDDFNASNCVVMTSFPYPVKGTISDMDDSIDDFIMLTWNEPECRRCESNGGICQFEDEVGSDVGCFEPWDLKFPVYERFAVLVIVTTGLCVIMFITFVRRKCDSRGIPATEISSPTNTSELENVTAKGLDSPTIQTYPTTVVSESVELPKPIENICPICLLDYKANDILRTIPSCMHYFHVDCIHEWLKRNGTCPLCRN